MSDGAAIEDIAARYARLTWLWQRARSGDSPATIASPPRIAKDTA